MKIKIKTQNMDMEMPYLTFTDFEEIEETIMELEKDPSTAIAIDSVTENVSKNIFFLFSKLCLRVD